jgi:hypothetical protein
MGAGVQPGVLGTDSRPLFDSLPGGSYNQRGAPFGALSHVRPLWGVCRWPA